MSRLYSHHGFSKMYSPITIEIFEEVSKTLGWISIRPIDVI